MDKTEIKQITDFLNDVYEGLCEGEEKAAVRPHLTELYGIIKRLVNLSVPDWPASETSSVAPADRPDKLDQLIEKVEKGWRLQRLPKRRVSVVQKLARDRPQIIVRAAPGLRR